MSNPVLPDYSGAEADAFSATTDAKTGIKHINAAASDATTPTYAQSVFQQCAHIFELLGRMGGAVVDLGGLNVGVFSLVYKIAATEKNFAGVASQAMTGNATNYIYVDTDEALHVSTSAWPGTEHFRLAKVTTNASDITALVDCRMQNFQMGGNAWYSIAAASDVDLNNFLLKNVLGIVLKQTTTLTLASDVATPTQAWHKVDTEGGAASDNLVTLTADAARIGQRVLLQCVNAARKVTVKSSGNIQLIDGDCILDATAKAIELQQDTATTWIEVGRNDNVYKILRANLECNQFAIDTIGRLSLRWGGTLAIASDTISVSAYSHHLMSSEAGTVDDLKTITWASGKDGHILLIAPASPHVITVHDNSDGGGNIKTATAKNVVLSSPQDWLLLKFEDSFWYELGRSRWRLDHLVGTGDVLPWMPALFKAGSVSNGDLLFDGLVSFPLTIKMARGRAGTAPTGTSLIIHVKKNGASIFAADANAINIAAGAQTDSSDVVTATFVAGDRLTVEITQASSAANVGVTLEGYMTAKSQT